MAKRTYRGSCHCGRVEFEADIDFGQGTSKCNCTSCWKRRWWSVRSAPEDFRSLSGETELVWYRQGTATGRGGFCKHCGVKTYVFVEKAEWNPTEYVSINVATLDDLDPAALVEAPVQYCDGRGDNWWNTPAEVRHL
jgi:hypothetical protein